MEWINWVQWLLLLMHGLGYLVAQESLREWAKILVDAVGHLAWPLVVLVLGLFFSGPIRKLLTDGRLKSLSAPGFTLERDVEAGVDRAREALHFTGRIAPVDGAGEQQSAESPVRPSAEETVESPRESSATPPQPPARPSDRQTPSTPEKPQVAEEPDISDGSASFLDALPSGILEMVLVDPSGAVMASAEKLRITLDDLAKSVEFQPSPTFRRVSLRESIDRAYKYGLLTGPEAKAAIELATTRNRVAHAVEGEKMTPRTAAEYAGLCLRLEQAAREAAKKQRG